LLDKLPADLKSDPDAQKLAAVTDERAWMIIRLINKRPSRSGAVKDYEFSQATIDDAWAAGLADVRRSVAGWLKVTPASAAGVLVYRPTEGLPPPRPAPSERKLKAVPAPRLAAMRRKLKSHALRAK
jgi:hypothetical protein